MSKVIIPRVMSLDFLGEGWKDCHVKFKILPIKLFRSFVKQKYSDLETDVVLEDTLKVLKDAFIEGVMFDAQKNEVVAMKKEDIEEFPSFVINKMTTFVMGENEIPN